MKAWSGTANARRPAPCPPTPQWRCRKSPTAPASSSAASDEKVVTVYSADGLKGENGDGWYDTGDLVTQDQLRSLAGKVELGQRMREDALELRPAQRIVALRARVHAAVRARRRSSTVRLRQ